MIKVQKLKKIVEIKPKHHLGTFFSVSDIRLVSLISL